MINKAILNRRSVRAFSDKPVTDEQIKEIIKAAQFAPSAMNRRASEFLVIKDDEIKEKLFNIARTPGKQEVIRQAPVLLIPVINNELSLLPIQDLSLAIENIFLQATEMGFGSLWKNITTEEAEEVKQCLAIPAHFTLINIIPIGYPAVEPKPHSNEEFVLEKIHWGRW